MLPIPSQGLDLCSATGHVECTVRSILANFMSTLVRRLRPRGEARRVQILEAATRVFLENGYGGATIDLVVMQAGASKASIYSFFGGKEGLFAAIVDQCVDNLMQAFLTIDATDADIPTALAQIGRRYLEITLAPDVVGIYRLVLAEGARVPEIAHAFYRRGPDRLTDHLAEIFQRWQTRGLVKLDDPALMASQFLDAAGSDLQLRAVAGVAPDKLPAVIDRRVQHAAQVFSKALMQPDGQ